MAKFRMNRRALLRGAASAALVLPWLEYLEPERTARAASAPAKHLVTVFTPGGTVREAWRPTGTETSFELSPILLPFDSVRDRLLVVDGLDMKSAVGEQNQSGIIAWLTGRPQATGLGFATGPSLDQVLASTLTGGSMASLQMAVRWGTGKARGVPSPYNISSFADAPDFDPIPPRLDPEAIYDALFGNLAPNEAQPTWERSILDAVGKRYAKLAQRVGREDRARLEQHLANLREIEQQLQQLPGAACRKPDRVDTSDYDPAAGLLSDDVGSVRDEVTDAAIPKVGKLMMDMLVMALSCNLTNVASLQWSDTEAKHTFPWLDLHEHLHFYMNDGGYQPIPLTKIFAWYSQQHAYLIDQLSKAPGPNGSLLDDTVVFFGSNLQHPATHAKTDMPFLLAGNGGGLRPGRWLQYQHQSHNDLLVSIANLCGDERQTFGDPEYSKGPLEGLT